MKKGVDFPASYATKAYRHKQRGNGMLKTHYTMEGKLPVALTAIDESGSVCVSAARSSGSEWVLDVYGRFATIKIFNHSGPALSAFGRVVSTMNALAMQEGVIEAAEAALAGKKAILDKDRAELEQFLKGE